MKYLFIVLLMLNFACEHDSANTNEAQSSIDPIASEKNSVTNDGASNTPTNPGEETKTPTPKPTPDPTTQTFTEQFMTLINDHRMSIGLRPLVHHPDLEEIARNHSENMANKTVAFGHIGFSSRCSAARAALGGGNWCGENVAMGQKSPQAAFDAWMNSPGHRANIEQSRATHTGFGYAKSSSGTYYWTQIFLEI